MENGTAGGGSGVSCKLRFQIEELERELKKKCQENGFLEAEIRSIRRSLAKKDAELARQDRELHKLRSVLQQAKDVMSYDENELLNSLQEKHSMAGQLALNKKQGVSGQSIDPGKSVQYPKTEKDFRSKQVIKDALYENNFLKNLSAPQVREIVDYMEEVSTEQGSYVIREGDSGSHLYVSSEGEFEVIKEGKTIGKLGVGKAFGELAILYNCRRTASIKALTKGTIWRLERRVFQQIMMNSGMKKLQNTLKFLKTIPLFENTPLDSLLKLSDVVEKLVFEKGAYIIREGTIGDTFYVLSDGVVAVTRKSSPNDAESEIRTLKKGDYFGEQALLKTELRTANIIAKSDLVECLCFDRDTFYQLVGHSTELKEKDYNDPALKSRQFKKISDKDPEKEFQSIRLDDFEVDATLGVGGFGRVVLVHLAKDKSRVFALKCLKKQHIVETQQQEHVFSEKKIMMACRHNFVARLFRTYRDKKYVYLLMEACLGGELWTILRDRGWFDDNTTRFYIACVVSALEYLHCRGIIYRDLKPENLLLDSKGYVKMVDFGFSKVIPEGHKSWTFCGTPEYVAPEIILNRGHDRSVDFWSLGVLMGELLIGTPPFTANDPMKIYNIILRGIETVIFPRHVSRTAISLIKRFCKENPAERLGYQKDGILDIKKHRWYQGFDWDGLLNRALSPPIIPKIRSPTDSSNFDSYPKDQDVPADEMTGWDKDF